MILYLLTDNISGLPVANKCMNKHQVHRMHQTKDTLEEIQHKMDTYYKFIMLRHPLERIESYYRSSFSI